MTPLSGKSDNVSGYMFDDHSWETLDNLPGYGLMSTLEKVGQLAQYVLNDHSQQKSDNFTGCGLNESPQWDTILWYIGWLAQWVIQIRHQSQKKPANLPRYVLNDHSWGSWTTRVKIQDGWLSSVGYLMSRLP